MADSLLTASPTELNNIANAFAKAFNNQTATGSSGAVRGPSPKDQAKSEDEHLRAVTKSSKALTEFSKSAIDATKSFLKSLDIGAGLRKGMEDIQANMASGLEAGTKISQMKAEVMLGTRIKQLGEMNKQSRLASISMGGLDSWVNELKGSHKELYNRFGDTVKTTQFMTDTLDVFANSGLQPSLEVLNETTEAQGKYGQSLGKSMSNLYKLGVGYDESLAILKEATEDEHLRNRLRGAASDKERKQIMQGYLARIEEYKTMGMTTAQAKNAAKALEELGGKGPLERYKMAAKAQASLSAMGIEGASTMADFIRAGDSASDELRTQAGTVAGSAQDYLATARAQGGAQEMFASIMAEKGGLMGLIGKGGVFSTELTDEVRVSNEKLEALTTMAESSDKVDKTLRDVTYWSDIITQGMNNSIGGQVFGAKILPLMGAFLLLKDIWAGITEGNNVLHDYVSNLFPGFTETMDNIFASFDQTLATFGNDDAQARIAARTGQEFSLLGNIFGNKEWWKQKVGLGSNQKTKNIDLTKSGETSINPTEIIAKNKIGPQKPTKTKTSEEEKTRTNAAVKTADKMEEMVNMFTAQFDKESTRYLKDQQNKNNKTISTQKPAGFQSADDVVVGQ